MTENILEEKAHLLKTNNRLGEGKHIGGKKTYWMKENILDESKHIG